MSAELLAREFRRMLHEAHLELRTPDDEEERYVFELRSGRLTLPQHPVLVRRMIDLAEAAYGYRQGEHGELLDLAALRDELDDISGTRREVVWKRLNPSVLDAAPVFWVDLEAWIDDQFLMQDAFELLRHAPA